MTCPYRAHVIPLRAECYNALSTALDERLRSDLDWNGHRLEIRSRYGNCHRISLFPTCWIARAKHSAEESWDFPGDGLLLPVEIEQGLGSIGTRDKPPEKDSLARGPMRDPLVYHTCRRWIWQHDLSALHKIRSFNESCSTDHLNQIFHWRFLSGHLPLVFCLRVATFDRLVDAHPQLSWLLAQVLWTRGVLQILPIPELRSLFRSGPCTLLRLLGLPPRKSVVKVLDRLFIGELHENLLGTLKQAASDEVKLQTLLSFPPPLFAADIALQAAHQPPNRHLAAKINRALCLESAGWGASGTAAIEAYWQILHNGEPEDLEVLHRIRSPERLIREANRMIRGFWTTRDYLIQLKPPFPDLPPDVTFLNTPKAIAEAARDFSNCAEEKIPEAVSGEIALYLIQAGDSRGMLTLECVRERWAVTELLGPGNQSVDSRVRRAATEWLAPIGIKLPPHGHLPSQGG